MFLQKRKEIMDMVRQFKVAYKEEFKKPELEPKSEPATKLPQDSKPIFSVSASDDLRPYQEPAKAEADKPDWFLKACGAGLILMSLFAIDKHPVYALIFIGIGIACCFAAHDTPSPED